LQHQITRLVRGCWANWAAGFAQASKIATRAKATIKKRYSFSFIFSPLFVEHFIVTLRRLSKKVTVDGNRLGVY
jgi:hypothetical protein